MITDDAIRDALEHLARQAPGPDRVLSRLAGRDRVRRQRRALTLAGGAVAAAVTVGAPLVLLRDRHDPAPGGLVDPSADPSADPSPSPSIMNDRTPMRYRPTWLPDGMVETSRIVGAHDPTAADNQIRTWRNDTSGQTVQLQVGTPDTGYLNGLRRITVHGVSGWVDQRAGRPSVGVAWLAEPTVLIQVVVGGIAPESTAIPLQVANSVARDGTSVLEMPIALGWLPAGIDRTGDRVIERTPHGWRAMVAADNGKAPPQSAAVSATVGTAADVLLATSKPGMTTAPGSVTVRGVTGTFVTPQILLVPLDGGLGLRVAGGASQADLVQVADTLHIGPVPDLSWLGIR